MFCRSFSSFQKFKLSAGGIRDEDVTGLSFGYSLFTRERERKATEGERREDGGKERERISS